LDWRLIDPVPFSKSNQMVAKEGPTEQQESFAFDTSALLM
jgi:hypothetical protein